jgi:hypothetical protein
MPRHNPFTKETAADFARKAHAAHRKNVAAIKAALIKAEATPQNGQFPHAILTRVQAQMIAILDKSQKELSRKDVDALQLQQFFTALARASDVEFAYANRPKPGNWRSAPPKTAPGSTSVEPAFSVPASEPLPATPPDKPLTTVETPQELPETTPKESILPADPVPTTPPGEGS